MTFTYDFSYDRTQYWYCGNVVAVVKHGEVTFGYCWNTSSWAFSANTHKRLEGKFLTKIWNQYILVPDLTSVTI